MRIPSPYDISGPESLRPGSPAPVADMSGLAQGAENLANSGLRIVDELKQKQNVIDLSRAEAYSAKGYLDLENNFQLDPNYSDMTERATKNTQDIAQNAAALIRDPGMRERWLADHEKARVSQIDSLGDIGRNKANAAETAAFTSSLDDYAKIITEPSVAPEVRDKARADMAGSIQMAEQTGLLTAPQGAALRKQYIDGAEQQLALNVGDALIRSDPHAVIEGTGIQPTGNPLDDARTNVRIPIVAAPGVNVADVDPALLNRYEAVQSAFGKQVTVISGARDEQHNADVGGAKGSMHLEDKAIDLDVSALSKDERVRLIETASAMGFTGIGVYANSLHLDTGARRAWGPSYHSDSVPAWAKEAIDLHTANRVPGIPTSANQNVDPRFAALSYQQRATLFDQAKLEIERGDMSMRSGLETTAANAPAAIARTGGYDNGLPDANAFVQAYGAQQGIEKFKEFDASVKVAQSSFSMRTMSTDQIAALVEQSRPTSTGDDAALQQESYQQIAQAAQQTIKARTDDPNGYVQEVYPAVADAWKAVDGKDPMKYQQAISMSALAQETMGIQTPQLLPKAMAGNGAAAFNNVALPDEQRIGALTHLVLGTPDTKQQAQLFQQLVAAGVDGSVGLAMDALSRGTPEGQGAAMRLFQAALTDPTKIKLPESVKATQIDQEIQSQIFDTGQIGDIHYGLTAGSAQNANNMIRDQALIENSVRLRLSNGSAGGNLQTAIDQTVKDVFGDVKVVNGASFGGKAGIKALLPTEADNGKYQAGFDALLGQVGQSLAQSMSGDSAGMPTASGMQAIGNAASENYVRQALAEGYFTNGASDDQFIFIDPNTGTFVPNAAGEPVTFSTDDVLAAGVSSQPAQGMMPPGFGGR